MTWTFPKFESQNHEITRYDDDNELVCRLVDRQKLFSLNPSEIPEPAGNVSSGSVERILSTSVPQS